MSSLGHALSKRSCTWDCAAHRRLLLDLLSILEPPMSPVSRLHRLNSIKEAAQRATKMLGTSDYTCLDLQNFVSVDIDIRLRTHLGYSDSHTT